MLIGQCSKTLDYLFYVIIMMMYFFILIASYWGKNNVDQFKFELKFLFNDYEVFCRGNVIDVSIKAFRHRLMCTTKTRI